MVREPPLTFQCHSSIFRKLVGVKEDSGLAIQRVLDIEHILVLQAFIVKVEIPKKKKEDKITRVKTARLSFFILKREEKLTGQF